MKKEDIRLLISSPKLVGSLWTTTGLKIWTQDIDSLLEILAPIITPLHPLEYIKNGCWFEIYNFDKFLEGFVDFDIKEYFNDVF